jgi:NADH:ubiquinone oxidoreductase subunit 5 (subunit L)/multisubunit Na+/H+ antiporter MnhA subunit
MKYQLAAAVFVPLLGAFLLPFAGKISSRVRNLLALACVAAPFVLTCFLVPQALAGNPVTIVRAFPLGFNFILSADGLAVFTALVSSFISSIIVLYSFGYISHYQHQGEYYFMVVLFLGAMMGLVFSKNLVLLYLFWEITAITSWRLIGFFREKTYLLKADKAFLVTVFGSLLMLLGFIAIFQQTGTFDMTRAVLPNFAVALILCGILAKSATLPFHTWLPDAGVAPSPVTALLHAAILVKIGVYVFARLFIATYSIEQIWTTVVPVVAAVSAIVSAGAALVETDLKRIIAYSTVSQIGFIFFGLSTGSPIGIAAGLLYILMHGLAKAGLFLCAGIIEQNTKVRDITKLGGLIKTMPVTAVSFLLCSFSVMGIPPFGGFFSKYLIFSGGVQSGHLLISGVFLVGAVLTIVYLLRVFLRVFTGDEPSHPKKEGEPVMVFSVALLTALSLVSSIFIGKLFSFTQVAVTQMLTLAR